MKKSHAYSESDRQAIYRVMAERRDMRHFNGEDIEEDILHRILMAAHMAPSVGLMQPWRFIRIAKQSIRQSIFELVDRERKLTAAALGEREQDFLKLKVEGVLQCAEVIVAALPDNRKKHIFGRRTMPQMDLASLSCAIQNMWLAARAEGIGMGWVSLFDPAEMKDLLAMPESSEPIAVLCIGQVDAFYEKPMLVMEKWTEQMGLDECVFLNRWGSRGR